MTSVTHRPSRVHSLWLTLGIVAVLAACQPLPAAPARFGSAACNTHLPGSTVLADVDGSGVPIVCEPQLPGAPAGAEGWWDGATIHVWPATFGEPGTYVLVITGHEYGHAIASRHPDWLAAWEQERGLSAGGEDFATAWAWCLYPHPVGVGYRFAGSIPTSAQCGLLAAWYPGR